MSTSTTLSRGKIYKVNADVTILDVHSIVPASRGVIHYNPGMARDDKGNLWICTRSVTFPDNPQEHHGLLHPMHYQNHLNIGLLDEDTMTISKMKEVVPDKEYEGFQWGIEDVRLFWREDGLHGIGVILPVLRDTYRTCQAEILIDYSKGTYKLIKNYGQPFNHPEKNWMPPESPSRLFDFTYSPTQVYVDGQIIGDEHQLDIHGGTPLIPYEGGYLSIGHVVCALKGQRTYAQVACKWDARGMLTEISQFFHLDTGWREHLQEFIEFGSGLVWSKDKVGKEVLFGIGSKDELTCIARIDVSEFIWQPYTDMSWYRWGYVHPPSYVELPTPATGLKGVHEHSLTTDFPGKS